MEEKPLMVSLNKRSHKAIVDASSAMRSAQVSAQSEQLQNIFNHFPEGIVVTDVNGRIEYMNMAAEALLGERAHISGPEEWPRVFGLYLEDETTQYPADELPLVQALRGQSLEREMILRREGKETGIWIAMHCRPLSNDVGHIQGAVAVLRNISTRKSIESSRERDVQRTETLYRLSHVIAQSGNDLKKITRSVAVLTSTAIGDLCAITLLNREGEKIHIAAFYDPDPKARTLMRKLVDATASFDRDQGITASVIRSGEPLLIESTPEEQLRAIVIPELTEYIGEIGVESVLAVPMIGRTGVMGAISISRHRGGKPYNSTDQSFLMDIAYRTALAIENCRLLDSLRAEVSKRKSVKKALNVSEERFRAIFESTALGIKVLNVDGNILQTNSAFQGMLGYDESEFVGRYFADFIHPEDMSRASKIFHDLKVNRASYSRFEHRGICRDGATVWLMTVFTAVKSNRENKGIAFIVGIIENITEQKRIQIEMREMSERLQSSVEMERLRLAQELHDSPMQTLYTAIYQLEELRSTVDPQIGSALDRVNGDVKSVLHELRTTAKELRPPTIFSFGLENAIRSHVGDIMEKFPNINISLSLAHDQQILPENVRLALFRVVQQSLANVLRHSNATEVAVRFSFDAEEARLEIADNGKGFSVPATWIDFARSGHYGLAGASERISILGGSFTVESEPGKSTVVRATVPWNDSVE